MRILVGTQFEALLGGRETYLAALLPHLQRTHELGAFFQEPLSARGESLAGSLELTRIRGTTIDAVVDQAREFKPDLVFSHGFADPAIDAALMKVAPTCLFTHDYAGVCISGEKRWGFPRPRPCGRALGPGCLLHYLPHRCGGTNPVTALRLYGVESRRRDLLARYAQVVVGSRAMRRTLEQNGVSSAALSVAPLFSGKPTHAAHVQKNSKLRINIALQSG